ncbi:MBL fold metallo-hydrolase [Nocardioides sp. P5_E3]
MCGIPDTPFTRRALLRTSGAAAAVAGATATAGLATPAHAAHPAKPLDRRTRLVLLGTSGGPIWWTDSNRRGISSAVVVGDAVYMVDCGDGAPEAWRPAGLLGPGQGQNDMTKLRALFLTHLHSDHISDYPTLLLQGFVGGGLATADRPLHVYGPGRREGLPHVFPPGRPTPAPVNPENPGAGTVDMTNSLIAAFATDINDRIFDSASPDIRSRVVPHDIAVPAGASTPNIPPVRVSPFHVYEDDRVKVTATLVDHGQMYPAFGFRFDTDDGSIVFSGDTTLSDNLIELARDCDYLVHEVIDQPWVEQSVAGLPVPPEVKQAFLNHLLGAHTTVEQVGAVAQAAGAKTLVLNHFVPGELPRSRWRRAARTYDGRLVIGEDLMQLGVGKARA